MGYLFKRFIVFIVRLYSIVCDRLVLFIHRLINPELVKTFSVESHLTYQERIKLYSLTKGKTNIAEIGSYIGASACCFGVALKENGVGSVFCVDTWNNDSMSEGNRDTWFEFSKNTENYKSHIIPIRGFSTEVVEQVRAQAPQLDILFIDGDHSYDGVKADWEAYRSFLRPGSIVIFHDYGWAEGVQRVVNEDVLPSIKHHYSLPNMWWGTFTNAL